tara:strand:- start:332 stop:571 length:240 start_codon:yes stop_codon:yes gene_type:complete
MKESKTWICPVCEMRTDLPPALCRRDNKTEICSSCGTKQGLDDFIQRSNEHQYPDDKYKEMVNEDHAAKNQSESDSYPE